MMISFIHLQSQYLKTDTEQPEIMDASDWYDVDVITCAAPNLRVQNNYNGKSSYNNAKKMTNDELLKLHEKRLKEFWIQHFQKMMKR